MANKRSYVKMSLFSPLHLISTARVVATGATLFVETIGGVLLVATLLPATSIPVIIKGTATLSVVTLATPIVPALWPVGLEMDARRVLILAHPPVIIVTTTTLDFVVVAAGTLFVGARRQMAHKETTRYLAEAIGLQISVATTTLSVVHSARARPLIVIKYFLWQVLGTAT